jgi:uncharacterized membrane protein YeaQ/YmgE (transglycosylase-associated protein family)
MEFILICLVIGVVCGALGAAVTPQKGLGFLLGFLLGPIGVLIAVFLKSPPAAGTTPPAGYIPSIHRQPSGPPPLPDAFLIRRGFGAAAETFGPYSLEEVMDHLTSGALLPSDHYQTPAGHWALLEKTGLCPP